MILISVMIKISMIVSMRVMIKSCVGVSKQTVAKIFLSLTPWKKKTKH